MAEARERMMLEDSQNPQDVPFDSEPRKYSVNLYISDEDLNQLYRLMNLGVSKSKEAITRAKRFPTQSLRSKMTIERHEETIQHIETLRRHLTDECQW